ncbi:pheromone/general odorant binding protein, partial [Shewanella sp. A25]|nr:pheromone/general odorant binding protein [Shewanella shenzhenensis]
KKENGYEGDIGDLNYTDPSSVPRPAMCYMACFMGKQKVMKPDGGIDFEYAKKLYSTVHKGDEKIIRRFHWMVDQCA